MSALRDGFKVVVPPICLLSFALVSPAVGQHQEARGTVRCESNGPFTRCPAYGSWRGARLVQQLSQKACIQGKTWGFDRNAVWVIDGCRGVFDAGDPYANAGERVTCAGTGGRTECPADTRYGVTLVRQVSSTRCVQGSTWGTSQNAIWVDRGCRGEFQIGSGAAGGETTKRITCGNPAGQQVTCPTNGSATGVRLVRDLSYGRCQEGQSWGHTDSFIWVNRGCRAEFEVTYRGAGGPEPLPGAGIGTRQITCGSFTNQQVTCKTGGYATSVRLRQDMSGGRCRQGRNWGNTDSFIWTNGGCRGAFEVSYGGAGGAAPIPPAGTQTRQITCGLYPTSQQVTCKTGGNATSVRLVKDLSGGNCRQSQTWGNTDSFIWTNNACRGQFEVTYGGSAAAPTPATRVISCGEPSGGSRVSCNPFGRVASVRLLRDMGGNRCRQGSTWGYTENDIWASQGCYGQFEVSYVATPQPR
jgi:hypothetical protein